MPLSSVLLNPELLPVNGAVADANFETIEFSGLWLPVIIPPLRCADANGEVKHGSGARPISMVFMPEELRPLIKKL